jgi:hypothetical protein
MSLQEKLIVLKAIRSAQKTPISSMVNTEPAKPVEEKRQGDGEKRI